MKFHEVEFNEEEIEIVKEQVEKKNKELGYNNIDVDKDTRWCGVLGELAFKEYLKDFGLKEDIYFTYEATLDLKNTIPYDFIVGIINPLKLDVKTSATDWYPKKDYACNVNRIQYEKGGCDGYIFARYIKPKRIVVLLGWLLKADFDELKTLIHKGDKEGKYIASSDHYQVPIDRLRPLFNLTETK